MSKEAEIQYADVNFRTTSVEGSGNTNGRRPSIADPLDGAAINEKDLENHHNDERDLKKRQVRFLP